jgi:hypothetical protein
MIGVVRAEVARTVRRWSVAILTAMIVAISVLVTLHNLGQVPIAAERLASARGEHAVDGCVVYADGTNSGVCPGASQQTGVTTDPGFHWVTDDPQVFIDQDVSHAEEDMNAVRDALAPAHRVTLSLALAGSVPGIALAVIFGALVAGGDYAWGTGRVMLLAARSRGALFAGKIVLIWLVALAWLLLGCLASLLVFALGAPAGVARIGLPDLDFSVFLGAWCSLGLFAMTVAVLAAATRSALGAAAIGLGLAAVLRLGPPVSGVDLGRLDLLRTIARVLTPEPTHVYAGSIVVTGTYGLPPAAGPGAVPSVSSPGLLLALALVCIAIVVIGWAIARRQEVR